MPACSQHGAGSIVAVSADTGELGGDSIRALPGFPTLLENRMPTDEEACLPPVSRALCTHRQRRERSPPCFGSPAVAADRPV